MSDIKDFVPPLFGGWTPTYHGDPCAGGHTPQSVRNHGCDRCGRKIDPRRCLCGRDGHYTLSRSFCPTRKQQDQKDAEDHKYLFQIFGVV